MSRLIEGGSRRCEECLKARRIQGRFRVTVVPFKVDPNPPEVLAHAGRSYERDLCRPCLRTKTDNPHLKVERIGD